LGFSGWSRVLGIDAVGGAPHCNVGDECCTRVTSRCSPYLWALKLAGVILDLVGEVGDKLGSLCQVVAPDGMGMERCWNARQPGQRAWVGRGERCETPVEDGRRVAGGAEIASAGGCPQVAE
jgi:hypothetical protein